MAKIKISDLGAEGVTHESPLEEQATLVWRALRRIAQASSWDEDFYEGHPGRSGPVVMKRVIEALFPNAPRAVQERLSSLVNQVLRKTHAAKCLSKPTEEAYRQNALASPIWWVSNDMPPDVVTVAVYVRTHGNVPRLASNQPVVPTRTEDRLTPHEAGEDRPPAPVEIHRPQIVANPIQGQILAALGKYAQPLSTNEVRAETFSQGHGASRATILKFLMQLQKDSQAFSRLETAEERALRAGGPARATASRLWSLTDPVPPRTKREVVPGVVLKSAQTQRQEANAARDEVATKILDMLSEANHGLYRKAFRDQLGLSDDELKAVLGFLERNQLVFMNSARQVCLEDWRGRMHATDARRDKPTGPPSPTRRTDVLDLLSKAPVPLTVYQMTEQLSHPNISTVRGWVNELIAQGKVYRRRETDEERHHRHGGLLPVGSRSNAMLHWLSEPVPTTITKETPVTVTTKPVDDVALPEPAPDVPALPPTDLDPRVTQIITILTEIVQDAAQPGRLEELEQENERLRTEVDRLTKATNGLQAALTALTIG